MSIPRTTKEVIREAQALGYKYDHASGGHQFYVKEDPDHRLGQVKKICIPTPIKGEKTLRSVLKGMGYFTANNLDNAGHPIRPDREAEAAKQQKLADSRFVHDMREWKTHMKRYTRGIEQHPGHAPMNPKATQKP